MPNSDSKNAGVKRVLPEETKQTFDSIRNSYKQMNLPGGHWCIPMTLCTIAQHPAGRI